MGRLRYLGTLLGHIWGFARQNKAYWMVPLIVVLLLIAAAVVFGEASAPFLYTLW